MIVGWSANLGNNWSTARANFLNGTGEALGALFGQSQLAGGGGPNALPIVNLWGNGTTIPGAGLTTGFTLATIVPEPSTCTLAALGTAAMVAVRR